MAGDVDIANAALSLLGADATIVSIHPADGSIEAGLAARFLPGCRRLLLTTFEWGFAKKRVALSLLVNNPSEVWKYAYQEPAKCLKAWRVLRAGAKDEQDSADFEREGRVILTNERNAQLSYTEDITDYTLFTPSFESALAFLLASYMAGPIIRGSEGARAGRDLRERAIEESRVAVITDANAAGHKHEWENDFTPESIKARN